MIDLGVRVEFYEQAFEGEPSKGFLGVIERSEGYRALAVPAVGERIMASSLRLAAHESETDLPYPLPGGEQLPVRFVEHGLVPERDGKVPAWWEAHPEPSVTIVLHLSLSLVGSERRRRMIRQFVADGWLCDGPEGSELRESVLQAREELGLS
ncbi:hypothetical protein [Streptomyces sp. NBC_01304]|uniref:hypothetical protein n=1 Tax=Streptomyces sp. NBC_01304 TaxID=2903818 RepID=UPI002E1660FF|nr:hypothetical protein OG430_49325 [Streptomyces sp. NBC_01304]